MSLKHELQSVISGNGAVKHGKIIQTIASHLRRKREAISEIEKTKFNKEQEAKILIEFVESQGFWYKDVDKSKFIGEGAEQKIFEFSDPQFVLKLNDSIFYKFWIDYLNSLLIHNYLFPHLAYELLGFYMNDEKLNAIVKGASNNLISIRYSH